MPSHLATPLTTHAQPFIILLHFINSLRPRLHIIMAFFPGHHWLLCHATATPSLISIIGQPGISVSGISGILFSIIIFIIIDYLFIIIIIIIIIITITYHYFIYYYPLLLDYYITYHYAIIIIDY